MRHAVSHSLVDKRETGIFKQNWFSDRKNNADTEIKNGFQILKLDETSISSEINIDENWKNNLLYMIYVNITVGNITIDFLPTIFKQLLINLLLYKKLFVGVENKDNEKIEREFIKTLVHQKRQTVFQKKSGLNERNHQNDVVSFKKVSTRSIRNQCNYIFKHFLVKNKIQNITFSNGKSTKSTQSIRKTRKSNVNE